MSQSTTAVVVLAFAFAWLALVLVAIDLRKPRLDGSVKIIQMTPDMDFTGMNGGVAWVPGQGLLVYDPDKYELKMVERHK